MLGITCKATGEDVFFILTFIIVTMIYNSTNDGIIITNLQMMGLLLCMQYFMYTKLHPHLNVSFPPSFFRVPPHHLPALVSSFIWNTFQVLLPLTIVTPLLCLYYTYERDVSVVIHFG